MGLNLDYIGCFFRGEAMRESATVVGYFLAVDRFERPPEQPFSQPTTHYVLMNIETGETHEVLRGRLRFSGQYKRVG